MYRVYRRVITLIVIFRNTKSTKFSQVKQSKWLHKLLWKTLNNGNYRNTRTNIKTYVCIYIRISINQKTCRPCKNADNFAVTSVINSTKVKSKTERIAFASKRPKSNDRFATQVIQIYFNKKYLLSGVNKMNAARESKWKVCWRCVYNWEKRHNTADFGK